MGGRGRRLLRRAPLHVGFPNGVGIQARGVCVEAIPPFSRPPELVAALTAGAAEAWPVCSQPAPPEPERRPFLRSERREAADLAGRGAGAGRGRSRARAPLAAPHAGGHARRLRGAPRRPWRRSWWGRSWWRRSDLSVHPKAALDHSHPPKSWPHGFRGMRSPKLPFSLPGT